MWQDESSKRFSSEARKIMISIRSHLERKRRRWYLVSLAGFLMFGAGAFLNQQIPVMRTVCLIGFLPMLWRFPG